MPDVHFSQPALTRPLSPAGSLRATLRAAALALLAGLPLPATAQFGLPARLVPVPAFAEKVADGSLPPLAERLPAEPLVVDLTAMGKETGQYGGTLTTLIGRRKDTRQMTVYGYARLMGYDENYELQPDILKSVEVEDGRRFTLHLRKGHKWSDGAPFTSEDFRYYWEDVVNNPDLTPAGPEPFLRPQGELPTVTFPDAETVVYDWPVRNPRFLQTLAQARPPFIYRPAHYLKTYHARYTDPASLQAEMATYKVASWAALHNKFDNMYECDNPGLPSLQPWVLATEGGKSRFVFERNPYYHRVDATGQQLPYLDAVEMLVASGGLVATKANAGETQLQARGLSFKDIAVLKKGEMDGGNYATRLWENGTASQIAIHPNLNYADPAFRSLFRDVRFRRALSLGIDRHMVNRALYFGLAAEGGMTVLPQSPFYRPENLTKWATYDPAEANALLDEIGLTDRTPYGIRLLPDGRPLRIVIETAGERSEVEDALQILTDTWRDIGVELVQRPLDRDILRNRVFAGLTMAAVWYGWDNGLPQPDTPPDFAVPQQQEFFSWPMWGQYFQTHGEAGEAPDLPAAQRLMELADIWEAASTREARAAAWQEIVDIHADQLFAIGLITRAPQPIVVNQDLHNVPVEGLWAWDPGAHFGVYHPDSFFFAPGAAGAMN